MYPPDQIQIHIQIRPLLMHWPPTSQRARHELPSNQALPPWRPRIPPDPLPRLPSPQPPLQQIQIQTQSTWPWRWRALVALLEHSLQPQQQQLQRRPAAVA